MPNLKQPTHAPAWPLELRSYAQQFQNVVTTKNDYPLPCMMLALDIAQVFTRQQQTPRILGYKTGESDMPNHSDILVPRPFAGNVTWYAHFVCENSGVVYDPMLPEPLTSSEYPAEAFLNPAKIFKVVEGAELNDLLTRWPKEPKALQLLSRN